MKNNIIATTRTTFKMSRTGCDSVDDLRRSMTDAYNENYLTNKCFLSQSEKLKASKKNHIDYNGESSSSEALAEALSSSLASIAAAGCARNKRTYITSSINDDGQSNNSSEEGTTNNGLRIRGDSGPAVVSSAMTSSGGDDRDRDSSGGNASIEGSNNSSLDFNEFAKASADSKVAGRHNTSVHMCHKMPSAGQQELHHANDVHTEGLHKLAASHADSSGVENENKTKKCSLRSSNLQSRRNSGCTVRRTGKNSEMILSSTYQPSIHKHKTVGKRFHVKPSHEEFTSLKSRKRTRHSHIFDVDKSGLNGGSSCSGTEGGYAGSASSAENDVLGDTSSPSVSSSEEGLGKRKARAKGVSFITNDSSRPPVYSTKQDSNISESSELADFSSADFDENGDPEESFAAAFRQSSSRSPSITSSSDEQDEFCEEHASKIKAPISLEMACVKETVSTQEGNLIKDAKPKTSIPFVCGKPPILSVGCDVMAHILTFLEPPCVLDILTMPLSNDWLQSFTRQSELWRVLCLLEPFKAQVSNDNDSSDEDSSNPVSFETDPKHAFGKFRLLFTSFVRCMRYLARIKDDALHGRPPSVLDYSAKQTRVNFSNNQNLQHFLARARGVIGNSQNQNNHNDDTSQRHLSSAGQVARAAPIGVADDGSSSDTDTAAHNESKDKKKKLLKYGHSMLTQRLLGPAANGDPGNVELPWSCAIYSIVNWMVAFADVEGIQAMCLRVLPFILEDEQQRITAQRAGLTDVVLRGMVMFPGSSALHTAAFHTIVLLARPLGGREGMLFHSSMVNASGIFSSDGGSQTGRTGIAVMLDSMRRFQHDEVLQAMSCWSLVNIALAPSQKEMLVGLGGIQVTANAMMEHPFNAEVQFRALFALINLVIPSVSLGPTGNQATDAPAEPLVVAVSSEKEMLDEMVNQIVSLVVAAMKNFCSSEAILNRACLVLHNLSLTQDYHGPLLWAPHCYQMLEWCLANYPTDQVLQQSAAGTLHRLQITLSRDNALRTRFTASLQSQQQLSFEEAHREAVMLHEQHIRQQHLETRSQNEDLNNDNDN